MRSCHPSSSRCGLPRACCLAFVLGCIATVGPVAAEAPSGVWRTRGFEEFRAGTMGNAGENLYVSRAGVLQRIHQYDFNRDGWVDPASRETVSRVATISTFPRPRRTS